MWDSWKESQKIEKLEKAKEEMKSNFDGQKQEILDLINDETRFKQTCFPEIFELERSFQELEESIKKTQECTQGLEKWIQTGEDFIKGEDFIDVEPEEEWTEFMLKFQKRIKSTYRLSLKLAKPTSGILNLLIRKGDVF